jgi:hypothetical protein
LRSRVIANPVDGPKYVVKRSLIVQQICLIVALIAAACGCHSPERSQSGEASALGTQWGDPGKLTPGPIRHDPLNAGQIERITKLHDAFREVDPTPQTKWLDDFKRDQHPDREIQIYEGMAEAYTAYCASRSLSIDAKRDVYQVVLLRSGAPDDDVLKQVKPKVLTRKDITEILVLYKIPPTPVVVRPALPSR